MTQDRDGFTDDQKFGKMSGPLRYAMIFIDRIGFPIFAFLLMSYMSFVTLTKMTNTLAEISGVLSSLRNDIQSHQKWAEKAADRLENVPWRRNGK